MPEKFSDRERENMTYTRYEDKVLIQLAKLLKEEHLLTAEEQVRFLKELGGEEE